MLRFIVGAVAAGLAIWMWGEEIRRYAHTGARAVRNRAADTLQAVGDKAEGVLDSAKEQVHTTFQAGREIVQPKAI
jgi:hypothetical protein